MPDGQCSNRSTLENERDRERKRESLGRLSICSSIVIIPYRTPAQTTDAQVSVAPFLMLRLRRLIAMYIRRLLIL